MIKFTFLKFNLATVGQEGNLGDQLGGWAQDHGYGGDKYQSDSGHNVEPHDGLKQSEEKALRTTLRFLI